MLSILSRVVVVVLTDVLLWQISVSKVFIFLSQILVSNIFILQNHICNDENYFSQKSKEKLIFKTHFVAHIVGINLLF